MLKFLRLAWWDLPHQLADEQHDMILSALLWIMSSRAAWWFILLASTLGLWIKWDGDAFFVGTMLVIALLCRWLHAADNKITFPVTTAVYELLTLGFVAATVASLAVDQPQLPPSLLGIVVWLGWTYVYDDMRHEPRKRRRIRVPKRVKEPVREPVLMT